MANKILLWWENRSSLIRALVYTVNMVAGLFLILAGKEIGVIGGILLYCTGWLSRHTQNPKAGNILDSERHPVMDYHD